MSTHRLTSTKRAALVIAALAAFCAVSPAFAAETVAVSLVGERGGEMAIKLDHASMPAGTITFHVLNSAMNTPHEMVLLKANSADAKLDVDAKTNRVSEAALPSEGEVSGLKAGQSGDLTVKLEPGNYVLICNLKGHYAAGMHTSFTVTAAAG